MTIIESTLIGTNVVTIILYELQKWGNKKIRNQLVEVLNSLFAHGEEGLRTIGKLFTHADEAHKLINQLSAYIDEEKTNDNAG